LAEKLDWKGLTDAKLNKASSLTGDQQTYNPKFTPHAFNTYEYKCYYFCLLSFLASPHAISMLQTVSC
jgi:hypothetical protein